MPADEHPLHNNEHGRIDRNEYALLLSPDCRILIGAAPAFDYWNYKDQLPAWAEDPEKLGQRFFVIHVLEHVRAQDGVVGIVRQIDRFDVERVIGAVGFGVNS